MELRQIKTQTTWEVATDSINHNNGKINEAVTRLEKATYKNKGYFKSLEQLQNAIPVASAGSRAYVGIEHPFAIYEWNTTTSSWIDSGTTGGDESLNLNNYYTKDEAAEMFIGSDNVRFIETRYTQEQIDQMVEDGTANPNTLYLAFVK